MTKIDFGRASVLVWTVLVLLMGLIYYINHYLPRGPMYATGDYACQNDERGPCGEVFVEDFRDLNLPDWALFIKKNGEVALIILVILGFYAHIKAKGDEETL